MPIAKTVRLNTGADMPVVGLGTWQSMPGQVEKAVEAALRFGKHGCKRPPLATDPTSVY